MKILFLSSVFPNALPSIRLNQGTAMKVFKKPRPESTAVATILAIGLAFHLSSIPCLLAYRIHWYDEGVHLYAASLWVDGTRPYADFFLAHPPGVIALAAVGLKLGLGLVGLRLIYWLGGLVLAWLVIRLAAQLRSPLAEVPPAVVAATAVAFTFSSEVVLEGTSLVMTDLPATLFVMLGVVSLLHDSRRSGIVAGLLVAMATGFKLQALVVLPGIFAWNWVRRGWRAGTRANLEFGVSFGVVTALIHVLLAQSFTHYLHDVYDYQRLRPRVNLAWRIGILKQVFAEPPFTLGLVGAAMLLVDRDRARRGLGWFCLLTTAGLTLAGNTLFVHYYLMIIPLMSVSAAWLVAEIHRSTYKVQRQALVLAVIAVAGVQILNLANRIGRPLRDGAWEASLVERLRTLPVETILTSAPKLAFLTGKRLPMDYYMVDACPLLEVGGEARYQRWVRNVLPSCDCVVITEALRPHLRPIGWEAITRSGKLIICAGKDDEIAFRSLEEHR